MFIHAVTDTSSAKPEIRSLMLEEALPHIRCQLETPREPLSYRFWPGYEAINKYREHVPIPLSEQSLQVKTENNLRSALERYSDDLADTFLYKNAAARLKGASDLPKYTYAG